MAALINITSMGCSQSPSADVAIPKSSRPSQKQPSSRIHPSKEESKRSLKPSISRQLSPPEHNNKIPQKKDTQKAHSTTKKQQLQNSRTIKKSVELGSSDVAIKNNDTLHSKVINGTSGKQYQSIDASRNRSKNDGSTTINSRYSSVNTTGKSLVVRKSITVEPSLIVITHSNPQSFKQGAGGRNERKSLTYQNTPIEEDSWDAAEFRKIIKTFADN